MVSNKIHSEILSDSQRKLFPLLRAARRSGFYMVGGTAISLHLGHRKSIDFDLFLGSIFSPSRVNGIFARAKKSFTDLLVSRDDEVTGMVGDVKVTFFSYPFPIETPIDFEKVIKIPDLLTLGAMKAYALGRRSKWKDYVDLYFLLRDHFSIDQISDKTKEIFQGNFNPKLFREQLHFFEGVNYDEVVEYLIPSPPSDAEVKEFLRKASLK